MRKTAESAVNIVHDQRAKTKTLRASGGSLFIADYRRRFAAFRFAGFFAALRFFAAIGVLNHLPHLACARQVRTTIVPPRCDVITCSIEHCTQINRRAVEVVDVRRVTSSDKYIVKEKKDCYKK